MEVLPVFPGALINQNISRLKIKSKYQEGTLSCVSKFSHAYSVGVKPYDQILSINGKKYEPLKQAEIIEPGKNKVKNKKRE